MTYSKAQKKIIYVSQSHVYTVITTYVLILHHYNVENITEKKVYFAIILRLSASLCLQVCSLHICVYNRKQ